MSEILSSDSQEIYDLIKSREGYWRNVFKIIITD